MEDSEASPYRETSIDGKEVSAPKPRSNCEAMEAMERPTRKGAPAPGSPNRETSISLKFVALSEPTEGIDGAPDISLNVTLAERGGEPVERNELRRRKPLPGLSRVK